MNNKNEPSKSELIQWLHDVEHETPKRFAGLLTELYFLRRLRKSGTYKNLSEGWAYIRDNKSDRRFWFKIFQDRLELSPAEEHFVSKLASLGHCFFSLAMTITNVGVRRLPDLELKVEEFLRAETGWTVTNTNRATKLQTQITEQLKNYLQQTADDRLNASIDGDLPFKRWAENLEIFELRALFLQRCLMNCRKTSPLDLDAVAITNDGKIAFVEFKRKYPSKGTSKPHSGKVDLAHLMEAAVKIGKELRNKDPQDKEEAKNLFNELCTEHRYKWLPQPSYGLDVAHFETLRLCSEAGFNFDYYVWNSADEPRKGAEELSEIVADLDGVLEDDLTEKKKISWWHRTLQPTDATGLTHTWGKDSGSYDHGCRVQITFDAAKALTMQSMWNE